MLNLILSTLWEMSSNLKKKMQAFCIFEVLYKYKIATKITHFFKWEPGLWRTKDSA